MSRAILPVAVRVERTGWPAVWLPLIFLWPVIIAVFCLALPLVVLVPAPRRDLIATLVASYELLCALHGAALELRVDEHDVWSFALY